MPGAFLSDDLPTFFASSDFGEASDVVTWKGTPVAEAIWDNEDVEAQSGEGQAVIIHQPMITAPSAAFAGIAEGDPVTVGGVSYTVKNWKDDGTGIIEVYLELA